MTADRATEGLDVYVVGGAVRDALLGLPPGDRDWVVLRTTPEQMVARGFIPVGGDFPVFLHPATKEEYALARTERKSGRGYKGFTFYTGVDVTLEDDLVRRDLTVNAIAQHPDGRLVDPFGGQDDIKNKVLRHVGSAFAEDPVRLLRLARFAARFHDFSIAPETLALARRLVESGEVDALVPERVWREISKGLYTAQPGRMFEVLEIAGALARVLPGFVFNREVAEQLARASRADLVLAGRFALMCRLSPQPDQIGKRLKAPTQCQDYARLLPLVVAGAQPVDGVEKWLELIERCDVIRKPGRFFDLIAAAACVADVDADAWKDRVAAVRSVDAGAIAMRSPNQPGTIKAALTQARRTALSALASEHGVRESMPAIAPNKAD